jgi:EAL domain-containing protein (putative c-di-GMP-specific phosphodiesterase class I)
MDDFGTGYSSLAYLVRFPLDIIKIDRSLVAGMESNAQQRMVVSAW